MTALPKHKMTVDEFLAWSERQPKEAGRFELWDGEIIEKHGPAGTMNAEKSQHWRLKARLFKALDAAFAVAGQSGEVIVDGASVPMPGGRLAEPDVVVYVGRLVATDTVIVSNPIIIGEVLSPSTARFDLTTKLQGYFELPSVMHYLIADPDVPQIIHHARGADGAIITRLITDKATKLSLAPPGLVVDLADVLSSG